MPRLSQPRRCGAPGPATLLRPVLTTGACMAATLLLVVPLLTFEVDARGGGGHGAADTVPALADTAAGTVAVDTALGMAAADT
jgi:hypothetical protein